MSWLGGRTAAEVAANAALAGAADCAMALESHMTRAASACDASVTQRTEATLWYLRTYAWSMWWNRDQRPLLITSVTPLKWMIAAPAPPIQQRICADTPAEAWRDYIAALANEDGTMSEAQAAGAWIDFQEANHINMTA